MLIIGLTGSIAMGKSTVAKIFATEGIAMISADEIVHDLYEGKAVPLIEQAFPGTTTEGRVDRQKLMHSLTQDPKAFHTLETIVHPLVREVEWDFIQQQKKQGRQLIIIEIPLLFETGAEKLMDAVVLVSAPKDIQKQRALSRQDMTEEKLAAILAKQMPDAEKRKKADFLIDTSKSLDETANDVRFIIEQIGATISPQAYEMWETQAKNSK